MNSIITNFLKAINEVEEFYHKQPNVYLSKDGLQTGRNDEEKSYERRLMTAIFSKYIGVVKDNPENINLFPDVEVPKAYFYGDKKDENIVCSFQYVRELAKSKGKNLDEAEFLMAIPDFIVHKSQDDMESENQLLSAELKTDPQMDSIDFYKDVLKLNLYLQKYKFQNAVFIISNKGRDFIESNIKTYFSNSKFFKADRSIKDLYFIFRPQPDAPFEAFTVSSLLYDGLNKI